MQRKLQKDVKILLAGICFLVAANKIQAAEHHHLQCWHCSSETIGAEDFCDVTFNEDNIPTDLMREHNISVMRSCNSTSNSEHERAVCRKTVEEINGQTVTKRFCYYTNKSDSLDHCNEEPTEKSVRRIFCQDCLTDKCNGATQQQQQQQLATWIGNLLTILFAKIMLV